MTELQTMMTGPGMLLGNHVAFGRGICPRVGQYLRFNAVGGFLRVEDSPSHGLGLLYRVQRDGTLRRVFGL